MAQADPGGQAARRRETVDRSRMGSLVGSQDRSASQGRPQDGREDSPQAERGNPRAEADEGEIPTPTGKPKERGSVLADVLRSVPDDLLVAECHRRGLTIEGGADV